MRNLLTLHRDLVVKYIYMMNREGFSWFPWIFISHRAANVPKILFYILNTQGNKQLNIFNTCKLRLYTLHLFPSLSLTHTYTHTHALSALRSLSVRRDDVSEHLRVACIFPSGLASSTDNIYTQTDVKSVYIYENQRWNPVTGYTNKYGGHTVNSPHTAPWHLLQIPLGLIKRLWCRGFLCRASINVI